MGEFNSGEKSSAIVKAESLYIANRCDNKIDKVGLGATIDIPAGETTNDIIQAAFQDVPFEEDETIDIKVGSIEMEQ